MIIYGSFQFEVLRLFFSQKEQDNPMAKIVQGCFGDAFVYGTKTGSKSLDPREKMLS